MEHMSSDHSEIELEISNKMKMRNAQILGNLTVDF